MDKKGVLNTCRGAGRCEVGQGDDTGEQGSYS